jgi:hypothetical protein
MSSTTSHDDDGQHTRHGREQEPAHHAERQQRLADILAADEARVHGGEIELAAVNLGDRLRHRHADQRQQAQQQQDGHHGAEHSHAASPSRSRPRTLYPIGFGRSPSLRQRGGAAPAS